jgi:hypothetical protein
LHAIVFSSSAAGGSLKEKLKACIKSGLTAKNSARYGTLQREILRNVQWRIASSALTAGKFEQFDRFKY